MERIPRRSRLLVVSVVSAVAVAVVAASAWFIGPPAYKALVAQVAETDLELSLHDGATAAMVAIPAGWSYRVPFNDAAGLDLTSPDGEMAVVLRLRAETDADAAIADAAPSALGELNFEQTAAGMLTHGRTDDGAEAVGAVSVGSHVVTFVSSPTPEYDAELAQLLTGIVVTP